MNQPKPQVDIPLPRSLAQACGFTLVELMVVISIITVLAALLLPTLEKSLRATRQMQCANNQRQLHLALILYAQDNSEYAPCNGSLLAAVYSPAYMGRYITGLKNFTDNPPPLPATPCITKCPLVDYSLLSSPAPDICPSTYAYTQGYYGTGTLGGLYYQQITAVAPPNKLTSSACKSSMITFMCANPLTPFSWGGHVVTYSMGGRVTGFMPSSSSTFISSFDVHRNFGYSTIRLDGAILQCPMMQNFDIYWCPTR